MPDDDGIIKAIGRLQGRFDTFIDNQDKLDKRLEKIGDRLEEQNLICKEFEVYKEQRKALPDRIGSLELVASNYIENKENVDDTLKNIMIDMEKVKVNIKSISDERNYLLGAVAAINMVIFILMWLNGKGWLKLGNL